MTQVEDDRAGERLVARPESLEGQEAERGPEGQVAEGAGVAEVAELRYHRSGDRLALLHTGVPAHLEGRGIGGALVRAAVALAETEGLTVVPYCPFARRWLEEHPDVAATVTIDWP